MTVSPAKPSYVQYQIPPRVWSVVVRADSEDNLCGVMSIQEVKVITYLFLYNVIIYLHAYPLVLVLIDWKYTQLNTCVSGC